ncbi:hypothetical protein V6N12_049846 [Hibiscus sabdariffa]|uniref:Uncharacterized protein n=1 Tax=Hibiscus sabdariffa TaxID=183260 RepID=A0ABR2GAR0_9ROSI
MSKTLTTLEVTKSSVGTATVSLGFSDTTTTAIANAVAGFGSAMAAQLDWTPNQLMLNGLDGLRKILHAEILTYAPSNVVRWASYSLHTSSFGVVLVVLCSGGFIPGSKTLVAVQGLSATMASGVSALITMPLETITARLQVLDRKENVVRKPSNVLQTVRNLV